MKILSLVENTSSQGMRTAHGLSLYIETKGRRLLFDVGPDGALFENAEKKGIDLEQIETVVISHGHRDHGGALEEFLKRNSKAEVYVQRRAFEKHASKSLGGFRDIGLDPSLKRHSQVRLLDGDFELAPDLHLFCVKGPFRLWSGANRVLYEGEEPDSFVHEQNLVISGKNPVLITGCGHTGIVNILEKAKGYGPKICVGGFHLCIPATGKMISEKILEALAKELSEKEISYYTCHCTGQEAFQYLSERMKIAYFSCGEELEIEE